MREIQLNAGAVREALLAAVLPVYQAAAAAASRAPHVARAEDLLVLIQLRPEMVRIAKVSEAGRPARELVRVPFAVLQEEGRPLREAVLAYTSGLLAAAVPDADEQLALLEGVLGRDGGFLLAVRPSDGTSRLFLAAPGQDLSRSIDVGTIGDAPMTEH